MRKVLLLFVGTVFLASCGDEKKPVSRTESLPHDSFSTGQVIAKVSLMAPASESMAVYLPSSFSGEKKYPVMFFLDPHGDGAHPLHLYDSLAEVYGFVLIGSNSSKNGQPFPQSEQLVRNMIADASKRVSVDTGRIYLCGFSGGAKVAMSYAALHPEIKAVIYAGAVAGINPERPLPLLGFAGTSDMNYTDLVAFDRSLGQTQAPHFLIEWKGKHEFPSAKVFEDAFLFVGKGSVPDYGLKKVSIPHEKVIEEQLIKQQYLKAFQEMDLNWWTAEIRKLNQQKKQDIMNERLLGFISLACYSYAGQALQHKDIKGTEHILAIYEMADPGNPDCARYRQELASLKLTK